MQEYFNAIYHRHLYKKAGKINKTNSKLFRLIKEN